MESTTLVLIGRTGNGKSSTGNSILGRNDFTSKRSNKSVTKECMLAQSGWKDDRTLNVMWRMRTTSDGRSGSGRIVKIVGNKLSVRATNGLFDTDAPPEFIDKEIVKCIDLAKDGVHGFLLVLSVKNRFTEEEAIVLDNLQLLFGPTIVDYMTVVFTGGDEFENEDGFTLDDYLNDCPQSLTRLTRRCNSRVVVFDNKTKSEIKKENQIAKLLELVDSNIAQNGNRPFTNELFEKAKSMATQLYYIRDKDKAYEDQIKLLKQTMTKNMHDMEQKTTAMVNSLQEQLKLVDSARKNAENESMIAKKNLNSESLKLQNELRQLQEELKRLRNPPPPPETDGGSCSIS